MRAQEWAASIRSDVCACCKCCGACFLCTLFVGGQRNNTIVFIGYQAQGTLGRILVNGAKNIKLFGSDYVVRAKIETLGGFSAHAGQSELVEWISNFENEPRIFLVHGEPQALDKLSQKLWEDKSIHTTVPSLEQSTVF